MRWRTAHNVRLHRSGIKYLHHPTVGDLTLTFESLELPGDPGLKLNAYTAEPGGRSREGLDLPAGGAAAPVERPGR